MQKKKQQVKVEDRTFYIDPMEWALIEEWRRIQERRFIENAQQQKYL